MAIYHYQEKTLSRTQGRSACSAASYITKHPLQDERTGLTYAYSARGHDVSVQIYTPKDAPSWTQNLQIFWNKVEAFEDLMAETRFRGHPTHAEKNERSLAAREAYQNSAVTAHTVICALPLEFTRAQSQEALQRFVERYFVPRGLCVTAGFHWEKHNPHVHLQVPPRALEGETFSTLKHRDLHSRQELRVRRHLIADALNEVAKENGLNVTLDARSYKDQGIDLVPTRHEGWFAQKYLKDASRLIQENREIKEENIKILFEKPENFLKIVMGTHAVVTRHALEGEIFKRVGGDGEMWALLSHRLTSWTREMARRNTSLSQTLRRSASLTPYLGSFGPEVPSVPSHDLAERLHASLPARMRDRISVEALRSATQSEASETQTAVPSVRDLETSNANVPPGYTLPSSAARLSLVNRFVDSLAAQGFLDRVGQTMRGHDVYTTHQVREMEERTTAALQTLSASKEFGLTEADVEAARLWVESSAPHRLEPEQRAALKGLTDEKALVMLEGPAGTGKTTVLKTVTHAYDSQGYRVLGMSFQGRTAAFLGEEVGISSETLDLYRRRWQKLDAAREELAAFKALPVSKRMRETLKAVPLFQKREGGPPGKAFPPQSRTEQLQRRLAALERFDLTSKDVIFIDEAYLAPSSSLRPVVERASEKGAKVILIGDRFQSLTFSSGDLTRQVRRFAVPLSLETIYRQKKAWQREATRKLSHHDVWGGFGMYQERGYVLTGSSYETTLASLVSDWLEQVRDDQGSLSSHKIQESLILARTNDEVATIDRRVVQALKQAGFLGAGHLVSRREKALDAQFQAAQQSFEKTMSGADKETQHNLRQAWATGTLTQESLKKSLASFDGDSRKVEAAFCALQHAAAALFAEKAENTFYEGQRVSFRSNDYSSAFKILPPWEGGSFSAKEHKALRALDTTVKRVEEALASLDKGDKGLQRRCVHALLEGSSEVAQKALLKAGYTPRIFGMFRDLKKSAALPDRLRQTYQGFKRTPKGVRNGQEGVFLGKGTEEGSFRVHLDKGPVIEFIPETLSSLSFDDKILRPAYAMTYDRSQGLTRDTVFVLLGEASANKLYVAGSRHRSLLKIYFNGAQGQDFKETLLRLEKSEYRPLVQDYVISEHERPYHTRVRGYLEITQKIQHTLVQIMELRDTPHHSAVFSEASYTALTPDQKTLFDATVLEGPAREKFEERLWAQFQDLTVQQQESAREIAEDLDGHRVFLTQAGLTPKTLRVAAGLEARALSPLEQHALHKVAAYDKVAREARSLWKEISATHPGALCYEHPHYATYVHTRKERNHQAHALLTGQALVGERLIGHQDALSVIKEPVSLVRKVMKAPEITVTIGQMTAHHTAHLSYLAEQDSFKGFEAAHQTVVAYRQMRNFIAASFKASHLVEPSLLEKRDHLALEILEKLGEDAGMTKVVKSLLSTDRDEEKLLQHAIRGEARAVLKTYHAPQDLAEARLAQGLGSPTEGRCLGHDIPDRGTSLRAPARQHSVDLGALNAAVCESVDLERLGRHLGLIQGKRFSGQGDQVRFGRKGSFSLQRDKNLWHDFETGAGGNAFSMVTAAGIGRDYKDQLSFLADFTSSSVRQEIAAFLEGKEVLQVKKPVSKNRAREDPRGQDLEKEAASQKQHAIRALVKQSVSLSNTQAETYLRQERGLTGPFPESVRYLPSGTSFSYPTSSGVSSEKQVPYGALLALAHDRHGTLKAVQVTRLNGRGGRGLTSQGQKLPKLTFGAPKGAFVDLSPEKRETPSPVFLAEGVETALSVKQAGAQRVMASLGVANLARFETEASHVVIAADQDGAGAASENALANACATLTAKGLHVSVLFPRDDLTTKQDFNDLLRQEGLAKVQDRLRPFLLTTKDLARDQMPDSSQRHQKGAQTPSAVSQKDTALLSQTSHASPTPDPASDPKKTPQGLQEIPQVLKDLQAAQAQEKEVFQRTKNPYQQAKASVLVDKAERRAAHCPETMAYVKAYAPETHAHLAKVRQETLKRAHTKGFSR